MKNITFLILTFICFQQMFIYGQNTTVKRCSTSEKMQELRELDPVAFDLRKLEQEQIIQNWIANNYENFLNSRTVITIPVVVQIFGETANDEVTDTRISEQLAVLNADFRKLNVDVANTPSEFQGVAADCEIEFCLATLDENNNATTGIIRKTTQDEPTQSGSDLWDTELYLNFLVYDITSSLLGFTYLASEYPNAGVHIDYDYFGKTGTQSPYNKGRTSVHEVGHWLNLEHIWGENNCGTDFVDDTPVHKQDNYGCPSHPKSNTCGTTAEMFMNYMDYTNDACMFMFSEGQKARMISAINLYRPGLINNGKCYVEGASILSIEQNTYKFYPNPTKNEINVEGNKISELKIVDQIGKVVYFNEHSSNKIVVNTEKFSNGIYFIVFKEKEILNVQKFEVLK